MRKTPAYVALFVLGCTSAAGADDTAQCSASYQSPQRLRIDGKLRASHDALMTCVHLACPAFISSDCTKWLGEVEAALPTVVFAAVEGGNDLLGGEISVDAEIVANATYGLPHPFDPGPHTITLR